MRYIPKFEQMFMILNTSGTISNEIYKINNYFPKDILLIRVTWNTLSRNSDDNVWVLAAILNFFQCFNLTRAAVI